MVGPFKMMKILHCRSHASEKIVIEQKASPSNINVRNSPDVPQTPIKVETLFNKELCRVCLQKGTIPIYGSNIGDKSLELSFFAAIEVSEDDPYPKYLCGSCDALLQSAILLRQTAQDSEKVLKQADKNVCESEPDLPIFASYVKKYKHTKQLPKNKLESLEQSCRKKSVLANMDKKSHKTNLSEMNSKQSKGNESDFSNLDKESSKNEMELLEMDFKLSHENDSDFSNLDEESHKTELLDMDSKQSDANESDFSNLDEESHKNEMELLGMDFKLSHENDSDFSDMDMDFKKESDFSDLDMDFNMDFGMKQINVTHFKPYNKRENPCKKKAKAKLIPLTCKQCEITFKTVDEYNEHIVSDEHVNKKVKCPICNKLLKYPYLKKHMDLHSGIPQYICDVCGKTFISQNHFARHHLTHSYDLPIKCQLCPYRGRFPESLKMHMRKHTGEKPYQCEKCPSRFLSKSNLNKHMRTHKTECDFKCDNETCSRAFHTKRELDLHVKVVHAGLLDYKCSYCDKAFGYKKPLRKHELRVHKRSKLPYGKMPLYIKVDIMKQQSEIENSQT